MPLAIGRGEAATALSRVLVSAVAAFATEVSVADRFSLFDSAVDVLRAKGPSAFADCNDRFRLDPPPSSSAPAVAAPSCSRPASSGGVVLVGRPPCLASGGGAAARAGDASSGLPLAAVSRGRAPEGTTGVGRPPADAGRPAGASSGGATVVPPPPPPVARLPPLASWADILRRDRVAAPPVLRAVLAPPVRAALRGHVARRLALCRAVLSAGPAPRLAGGGAAVLGKAWVPARAASADDAAARGRHAAAYTANAPGPEAKILRRTNAPAPGAAAASSVRGADAGTVEGARPAPAAGRPQRNRRRRRRRRSNATPDAAAEAVGRTRQGADGNSSRSRAADAPSLGVARAHAPPSGFRGADTTLCTAVAATGASPRLAGAGDARRRAASAPPRGLAPQRARPSRRAAARVIGALPPAVDDLLAATPLWGRRRNREATPTLPPARFTPRSAGVVADGARKTLASAIAAASSPRAGAGAAPCTPPRRATLGRSMGAPPSTPAVALTGAGAACGLPVVGAAVARFRRGGGRKAQPSRRTPLPPPPLPPPDLLLADTVLVAAVPLPGGGLLFRPRLARARTPPPPSLAEVPVVGPARPRTGAAVAAAAAAAAEARRESLRVPCASSTAARLAHSEPSARAAVTVSDERRNE